MFVAMNEGRVKGMLCVGQNRPRHSTRASSAKASRGSSGGGQGQLAHRDGDVLAERSENHERPAPQSGHPDGSLLLSLGAGREYEGSFTNTQRMLQWHFKAATRPATAARISG